jgi:hypothetical protein
MQRAEAGERQPTMSSAAPWASAGAASAVGGLGVRGGLAVAGIQVAGAEDGERELDVLHVHPARDAEHGQWCGWGGVIRS